MSAAAAGAALLSSICRATCLSWQAAPVGAVCKTGWAWQNEKSEEEERLIEIYVEQATSDGGVVERMAIIEESKIEEFIESNGEAHETKYGDQAEAKSEAKKMVEESKRSRRRASGAAASRGR